MLTINSSSGKAIGLSEGKADILLSNHANAESIVHVSKVEFGQVDQSGALLINTDDSDSNYSDLRVRVRFFLQKQNLGDEIMPTV